MGRLAEVQIAAFLARPTPEAYLALAEAHVASPLYEPYGLDSRHLDRLYYQQRPRELLDAIEQISDAWILSPRIHRYARFAYDALGDKAAAEREHLFARACMLGILGTGDGSKAAPYRVTSTEDEYELLLARKLDPEGQRLMHRDGRYFDVHAIRGNGEVWFDVTWLLEYINSGRRSLGEIRAAAVEAWQAGDYGRVVALLAPVEDYLSPVDAKRLSIARRKAES